MLHFPIPCNSLNFDVSPFMRDSVPLCGDKPFGNEKRQHTNLSSALRIFVLDFYRNQGSDTEPDDQMPETMERPSSAVS